MASILNRFAAASNASPEGKAAMAAHEADPYWEPKDRLPFRKLVDLEDALRSDAADLATKQDLLTAKPKDSKLQKDVLAASEKLRKTQAEHGKWMSLYFQYPGHWNDWDWRHRSPDHVQGQGNLYLPGQNLGPYYKVQSPSAANLKDVSGFKAENHIVPLVPLTANEQRKKNQANRNKSQKNRQKSINSSVEARVNSNYRPRIVLAAKAVEAAGRALMAAEQAIKDHDTATAEINSNYKLGPMEKQAARAAAATRKGELELARDGARQESEQRAQELAHIQEQRRNAVRNEKRIVGTIRNNRKAKRNANNAANAKAKNEMGPVNLNFIAERRNAQQQAFAAASPEGRAAAAAEQEAEQNRAAAPQAANANMAARGLFD